MSVSSTLSHPPLSRAEATPFATKSAATGSCASIEMTNTPGSCSGQSSRTRTKRPPCNSRITVRTGPTPSTVRRVTSRISQHH
ncbi:hypothetical protein [Streptomyces sp. NPDC059513]|uniref:hypothetical protein n=1 Tax=unclassified Streptomyces TaxID=2593676 RepID=UPI00367ED29F